MLYVYRVTDIHALDQRRGNRARKKVERRTINSQKEKKKYFFSVVTKKMMKTAILNANKVTNLLAYEQTEKINFRNYHKKRKKQ